MGTSSESFQNLISVLPGLLVHLSLSKIKLFNHPLLFILEKNPLFKSLNLCLKLLSLRIEGNSPSDVTLVNPKVPK